MALIAAEGALEGGSVLWKLLPWGLLAIAVLGLGGALWVERSRLEASQLEAKTFSDQNITLSQDVTRWKNNAAQMQSVITDQAAQLTQFKADAEQAEEIAKAQAAVQAAAVEDLNNQLDDLKAKANAHPENVRDLGPIVTDDLRGMQRVKASGSATTTAAR